MSIIVIIMYHCHKPIDGINLLGSWRRRDVFSVRYGQTYRVDTIESNRVELSFKLNTGRWIMSIIVIFKLINHRHKPINSINLLGS
jgi:hypothetical protein